MSQALLFFILRLAGAGLLLAFLGLIFWFLFRDLQSVRLSATGQPSGLGSLRVIANRSESPAIDSIIELSPVSSIGRSNRNTIALNDTFVSSEHALLTWRDSQWWLEDLGSRNGTQLNDVGLTSPVVVSAGDVITIGGIRFKLEVPGWRELENIESGIRDSNP